MMTTMMMMARTVNINSKGAMRSLVIMTWVLFMRILMMKKIKVQARRVPLKTVTIAKLQILKEVKISLKLIRIAYNSTHT